jgi:hypothetical protein
MGKTLEDMIASAIIEVYKDSARRRIITAIGRFGEVMFMTGGLVAWVLLGVAAFKHVWFPGSLFMFGSICAAGWELMTGAERSLRSLS